MKPSIFALAFVVVAAACSDGTGPRETRADTQVTLNLCSSLAGVWVAYQNQGGAWTQLFPSASNQVSFKATDKVSIAISESMFGSSYTEILNASAAELQSVLSAPCEEADPGTQSLTGTIGGFSVGQTAVVSAGPQSIEVSPASSAWTLDQLPGTGIDVIATRSPAYFSEPPDRIIVRRGVVPQSAPVGLDFADAEASAPLSAMVTLTNAASSYSVAALSMVITAAGTFHQLSGVGGPPTGGSAALPYLSLPDAQRLGTDEHILVAIAFDAAGDRRITRFYGPAVNTSIAFGPMVSVPIITTAATAPYFRPRAQIASQAEYPAAMSVEFDEATTDFSGQVVSITTTAAFLDGSPRLWDITVPDMSSANYTPANGLQSTDFSWTVSAQGGSFGALIGEIQPQGTTVLSSSRSDAWSGQATMRVLALTGKRSQLHLGVTRR